jgi:hypothetical protein
MNAKVKMIGARDLTKNIANERLQQQYNSQ